jgi:hypothetical protein
MQGSRPCGSNRRAVPIPIVLRIMQMMAFVGVLKTALLLVAQDVQKVDVRN